MTSDRRRRPPQEPSTKATPGGDTVTAAQDLEADEPVGRSDAAGTRPVDVEPEVERAERTDPDEEARTEPSDLESAERKRPRPGA